ncbi:MAG: caspase family protein, partial [Pseudomonadota bacterium]|nr:caspase family protein [Pseudomonadota bacterium]
SEALADIQFGNYNALVIGAKNYNHLTKLKTAINDAKSLAASLEKTYGIKVRLLSGPTRGNITDAVDDSLKMLELQDSLLIYCASHGWLDEATDLEYWLPVDAKQGHRSKWLSNTDITDTLKSLATRHVMAIADS